MLGWHFAEPWEGVTGGWWVHLGTSRAGLQPRCHGCTSPCPALAEAPVHAEEEEELDVVETPENSAGSGFGFDSGLHVLSLTSTTLSLAGAHELVRMER